MEWATSSWARRLTTAALPALALTLAVAPRAQERAGGGSDDDPWRVARAVLSEAMYLESGLGDLHGACDHYEDGLRIEDLDPELEAELLFRLGAARERLGQTEEATAAFELLLNQHGGRRPWGELAHVRAQRIAERTRAIVQLPIHHDFDLGLGDWLFSGDYDNQDAMQWTREVGRTAEGALLWDSAVRGQVRDHVYLSFASPSPRMHQVELWVRAVDFPAHLILSLVEEGGVRFASGLYVVEPADGWIRISSAIDDFYLFPGDDATRHPDPTRVSFLMLEDATATYSTDRGINRLLIDDVTVE